MSIAAYLDCNGCCDVVFVEEATKGFRARLRKKAAKHGWVVQRRDRKVIDLCPECARAAAHTEHG